MKTTIHFLLSTLLLFSITFTVQAQLSLALLSDQSTLLENETATYALVLSNESTDAATAVGIAFTLVKDFRVDVSSITVTSGEFAGSWQIDTLAAGASDTLRFEASSTGYAQFIAEVVTDDDLLSSRCFDSNCFPSDNLKCFYSNCTPESDEVLYPKTRAEISFQNIECVAGDESGCSTQYNITFENNSAIASPPFNLFLRAFLGESLFTQSGPTLEVPSIPANSTLDYLADFEACIEDRPFATVESLHFGLTQSDIISLFTEGRQTAPISAFDAIEDTEYCQNNNETDVAIRVESNGVIGENNIATYQVFVTNNGDETAEFLQITYGETIRGSDADVIAYRAFSSYDESSITLNEEDRSRFLDYENYWNIQNLAPGETAVLNVTATVQEFVDAFSADVFVNNNSFLDDSNTADNQTSIAFSRAQLIDLELSLSTNNPDIARWEAGTFTYTLRNNSNVDATGVSVRLYFRDNIVLVGGTEIIVSSGDYVTIPDSQFTFVGLWQGINIPANEEATLTIQLFNKVSSLSLCAEVIAADQLDLDSEPANTECAGGEDDEVLFSNQVGINCGFLNIYSNALTVPTDYNTFQDNWLLEETSAFYFLQKRKTDEFTYNLIVDKVGNLSDQNLNRFTNSSSTFVRSFRDGAEIFITRLNAAGDTILNELVAVNYPNPTAIVPTQIIEVSDGFVFGGFIVDQSSNQTFRGFLVKTDLEGQNAQTIIIEDIDDTLSPVGLLEDEAGNLFVYWATAGNFSLTGISADFTSVWTRQFASDTPSTTIQDIKLSSDETKIFVAVTDNFRGIVYAYSTTDGTDAEGSFRLTNTITNFEGANNIVGILPLENGNILVTGQSFVSSDMNNADYALISLTGEVIWSQSIENSNLLLRPIGQTDDGGYLFISIGENNIQLLKTNAAGERTPDCATFASDGSIDLELSVTSEATNVPIFTNNTFTFTLINNGTDDATGVEVRLNTNSARYVQVGSVAANLSNGQYFNGIWRDITVTAGDSVTLEIAIFNKSPQLELFAQVTSADQEDTDSTPFNGFCCVENEDDEAVFLSDDDAANLESRTSPIAVTVYPNPTQSVLYLKGVDDPVQYTIYDVLGRRLLEGQLTNGFIDLQLLASGTYFLVIDSPELLPIRFVKE